jgi:hypothetical protein
MRLSIFSISLFIDCAFAFTPIFSQSIPVGTPVMEDAVRRAQLLGQVDESISFSIRPLSTAVYCDSTPQNNTIFQLKTMPLIWKQQYNSDHPEGLNDGAMIPTRGYQTIVSGGIFARYCNLSIQLMPELIYAENRKFQGLPDELPDDYWQTYYSSVSNYIDIPEQFGKGPRTFMDWGQSSIRFTIKPISIGISNENLWWGPGIKNALLMTNNASGFKHISLNTVRPIKTFLGSFEGQMIGGRLEVSGYPNFDTVQLAQHGVTYTPKTKDWRYLNGMVVTYQPKWLPGLFLGATRSFISYNSELGRGVSDYLPVIMPLLKKVINRTEDAIPRDQLASVFVRWLEPDSHSEIYFEYGREDHNYDLTDLTLDMNHTRAYIVGFRKLTPINRSKKEYLDMQIEITQLGENISTFYRANGRSVWYTHLNVRDGYTNNGQYLGAGIGTSSNMQSASLAWVKGLKRAGLDFKRVVHEEDFWALISKDYRTHWVDIGAALVGDWDYKKFILNARLETIGSINYQHLYAPVPNDQAEWWDHGKIRYNIHAELGITYLF